MAPIEIYEEVETTSQLSAKRKEEVKRRDRVETALHALRSAQELCYVGICEYEKEGKKEILRLVHKKLVQGLEDLDKFLNA